MENFRSIRSAVNYLKSNNAGLTIVRINLNYGAVVSTVHLYEWSSGILTQITGDGYLFKEGSRRVVWTEEICLQCGHSAEDHLATTGICGVRTGWKDYCACYKFQSTRKN